MKAIILAGTGGLLVGAAIATGIMLADESPSRSTVAATELREPNPADIHNVDSIHALRANHYQGLGSIEDILSLPGEFARAEALYALAGRADSGKLQALIYDAGRIAEPNFRHRALTILAARLVELDPRSALAIARADVFKSMPNLASDIWTAWAAIDFDAALRAAANEPDMHSRDIAAQALYLSGGTPGNDRIERIRLALDIAPHEETLGQLVVNLAERSASAAIDYINDQQPAAENWQSTVLLAQYLSLRDGERSLEYARLIDQPLKRQVFELAAGRALAMQDPEGIAQHLMSDGRLDNMEQLVMTEVLKTLAERDVESAIKLFGDSPPNLARGQVGSMLAAAIARQDPERALAFARQLTSATARNAAIAGAISGIAESDPTQAINIANDLPEGLQRNSAIIRVVSDLGVRNPERAAELIDNMPNSILRKRASLSLLTPWILRDADAALDWISSSDDSDSLLASVAPILASNNLDSALGVMQRSEPEKRRGLGRAIVGQLAQQRSLDDALQFLERYKNESNYTEMQVTLITTAARINPERARAIAMAMPVGKARNSAMARGAQVLATGEPAAAAQWITGIDDDQQRSMALRYVASSWAAQDPLAAQQWLRGLPQGADRDQAILTMAANWNELTADRQQLLGSISDARLRRKASSAYAMGLAQQNRQAAIRYLQSVQMSDKERAAAMQTIEGISSNQGWQLRP